MIRRAISAAIAIGAIAWTIGRETLRTPTVTPTPLRITRPKTGVAVEMVTRCDDCGGDATWRGVEDAGGGGTRWTSVRCDRGCEVAS